MGMETGMWGVCNIVYPLSVLGVKIGSGHWTTCCPLATLVLDQCPCPSGHQAYCWPLMRKYVWWNLVSFLFFWLKQSSQVLCLVDNTSSWALHSSLRSCYNSHSAKTLTRTSLRCYLNASNCLPSDFSLHSKNKTLFA